MLIDTHTHMYPPSHLAAMQKTATEWQVGQMGGRRVLLKGEVPVVALTEAVESGTAAQGDGRPRGRHGGPVADLPECQFVGPRTACFWPRRPTTISQRSTRSGIRIDSLDWPRCPSKTEAQ